MSKPTKQTPKLDYTAQNKLPKLGACPTNWDMAKFYYQSIDDPQLAIDVQKAERAFQSFAKNYRGGDFTKNPKTLKAALTALNRLDERTELGKPMRYLSLLSTLNATDDTITKKLNLLSQRLTTASNQLLFFSLELAHVSKKQQKQFLETDALAPWRYELEQLFRNGQYQLSEPEEQIIRLLGDCSYGMWVEATEKMLGKRTVTYRGETIPVNSAIDRVSGLPFKEQPKLWRLIMQEIEPLQEYVEHELTAIATRKKISDQLRGYQKPYSATVIAYEDDEASVEALVSAVSDRGFALSKKFYRLKAKLHKQKRISYAQRSASIGQPPVIPFKQATEVCRDVFYSVNEQYGEIFDRLLTNGQIDVYPKAGKRGGAFCSGDTGQPTHVFLNHTDTFRSLETFAHEMGHAIHTERSKQQPTHYQSYSTTTAETASTLFESLLFEAILKQASATEQSILLHDKLAGDVATIQRQIAFFNFELAVHQTVRKQGGITHQELNQMMQQHLRSYCGAAVEIDELDGHSYIYVPHFRYGFYVYTYTFGILMSRLMAQAFAADTTYRDKIDQFLTAGGSQRVADIFASIGLDTKNSDTFEQGLTAMEREIDQLAKLTQKAK